MRKIKEVPNLISEIPSLIKIDDIDEDDLNY